MSLGALPARRWRGLRMIERLHDGDPSARIVCTLTRPSQPAPRIVTIAKRALMRAGCLL
jgi:hypothetical protein